MDKQIIVTLKFVLCQSPGKSALKKEGLTIQEYAEEMLQEMNLGDLDDVDNNFSIEIKAVEK